MLVRQDRAEGFRQIAFVAAERTLQRRAAIAALVEVALDDLKTKSITDIAEVTEKLAWTTDAPMALSQALSASFERFARISQSVEQALSLHSVYRKIEALKLALNELDGLQRSLIASNDRIASRILKVTNEWKNLVITEQVKFKEQADSKQEIQNPFVFGKPVEETSNNIFSGRQDIIRQVEENLLGASHAPALLLHGPRRTGKSSILYQLPRLLGPQFAPSPVLDCQDPAARGSTATFLRYFSSKASEGLKRRHVKTGALSEEELASEPFDVFNKWLDRVETSMPGQMRLLLCLDEYKSLKHTLDAGWGKDLFDYLRHLLQHRPKIALLFTGAHTFEEMGGEWTDRFISVRQVRVSFLSEEEVIPLLTKPIPEFDMTYAPEALKRVFEATQGQPFLTQAVAFELVQYLNGQQRREATPEDIEEAISRALVSGSVYPANIWNDAGEDGQAILTARVKGEALPDFPQANTWLRNNDVLNEDGSFAVPMVERWVKEKIRE